MVTNRINERVRVYAVYNEPGERCAPHERLRPVAFCWRNRQYRVREVTYVWRESRGESELYHFAVTAGEDRRPAVGETGNSPDQSVYELCYETRSLNWTLASVSCDL